MQRVNKFRAAIQTPGIAKVCWYLINNQLLQNLLQHENTPEWFTSSEWVKFDGRTVNKLLIILKNPEDWDQEIQSLQNFVTQLKNLKKHEELTDEISLQYDAWLWWITKYFPKVASQTTMLDTNYFEWFDAATFTSWQDTVYELHDELVNTYIQVCSNIDLQEIDTTNIVAWNTSYQTWDLFLEQAWDMYADIEHPSLLEAQLLTEFAQKLVEYFNLEQFDPANPTENPGTYITNIVGDQLVDLRIRGKELAERITEIPDFRPKKDK